jgi:hypothetical protein
MGGRVGVAGLDQVSRFVAMLSLSVESRSDPLPRFNQHAGDVATAGGGRHPQASGKNATTFENLCRSG